MFRIYGLGFEVQGLRFMVLEQQWETGGHREMQRAFLAIPALTHAFAIRTMNNALTYMQAMNATSDPAGMSAGTCVAYSGCIISDKALKLI